MYNVNSSTATPIVLMKAEGAYLNSVRLSTVVVREGEYVKLNPDGTVSPLAAYTDVTYGYVVVGNNQRDKTVADKVTICTKFRSIIKGKADGTVATGALVDAGAWDATDKLNDFKATAANGNIVGMAVVGGATNVEIEVGIY